MLKSKQCSAASIDEAPLHATSDLQEIADYIRERSPQAAKRVRAAILRSLQVLILFPRIGRRQSAEEVRKLITRRYPYVVYYVINAAAEES